VSPWEAAASIEIATKMAFSALNIEIGKTRTALAAVVKLARTIGRPLGSAWEKVELPLLADFQRRSFFKGETAAAIISSGTDAQVAAPSLYIAAQPPVELPCKSALVGQVAPPRDDKKSCFLLPGLIHQVVIDFAYVEKGERRFLCQCQAEVVEG
jgi:hypothetical protein